MKRFRTQYSENSITYWPSYEAGVIGIIFLVVLGTLFVTTAIWTLLDNPSKKDRGRFSVLESQNENQRERSIKRYTIEVYPFGKSVD